VSEPETTAIEVPSKPPTASKDARRHAALILEALGGLRSAPEAAEAMGVTLPRYYVLESRAVKGLVAALEPRPRGRQLTLEAKLERTERERDQLAKEVLRYQALYRASQRAIGVPREDAAPARRKKTTRTRRKKSRAEKLLPKVAPEDPEKAPPPSMPASDAFDRSEV